MKRSIPFLLSPILACAAITNVHTQSSPQQIVVTFTAASNVGACTLALSESPSLTPSVKDLDTTLFASSNATFFRTGVVHGNTATFVIGQRGMGAYSFSPADGNLYSRSLQVDTQHYGQITCGSDTATFTAHTAPLPAGMTHQDTLPARYPTIQSEINCVGFSGPCPRNTEQIVDPWTGVLATHVDMAGDFGYRETLTQFSYAFGSGWAIPSGYVTNNTFATISGATNPLIATVPATRVISVNDVIGGGNKTGVLLSFQAEFAASINDAACTSGNTNPDCAVSVCVTTNGVSCATNSKAYTLYMTSTPTIYFTGGGCSGSSCSTLTAYDVMQQPGKRIWNQPEIGLRAGNANCSGNTVTYNWDGHAIDPDLYTTGSQIWTSITGYSPITSIQDALTFNISASCTGTNIGVGGGMFGVMFSKGDAGPSGSNTLSIGTPYFNDLGGMAVEPQIYAGFLGMPFSPTNAAGDKCGILSLTGSDYCLDLKTGITNSFADNTGDALSHFYDSQGSVWSASGTTLTQMSYTGNYSFPSDITGYATYLPAWQYDHGNTLPTCGGTVTTQCWQSTVNITGLDTALHAFDSRYSSTPFNNFCLVSVEQDKLIFEVTWAGSPCTVQFKWSWMAIFDPYSAGSGAGCITGHGCFIAAHRNWEGGVMQSSAGSVPLHWMSDKEPAVVLRTGWTAMEVASNQFRCAGTPGCGWAIAGVTSSGGATCPGGSGFASCMTTAVDGDPYDQFAGSSLRVLGTYQIGDYAMLDSVPNGSGLRIDPELSLLSISGSTLTWGCITGTCPASGTVLTMVNNYPGSSNPWFDNGFGLGSTIFWNYAADPHGANASGNTIILDYSATGTHGWSANGQFSYGTTNTSKQPFCTIFNGYCYSVQNYTGKPDSTMVTAMVDTAANRQDGLSAFFSSFAGKIGFDPHIVGNGNIQTHPNLPPPQSGGVGNLGVDARPFLGIAAWPSTVTAVSGCANVYSISYSAGTLFPKTFDIYGFAGMHVLTSMGAPGMSISCGAPGAYTLCYAYLAGDCHSGSSAGMVYVNVPFLVQSWKACYFNQNGFASNVPSPFFANDVCVGNRGAELNAFVRYDTSTKDISGRNLDFLGYGFNGPRPDQFMGIFSATTNSSSQYPSWYLFACQPLCGGDTHAMTMAYKAPQHYAGAVDHTTYVPITVYAGLPAGATKVAVKFWYTEYGNKCNPNYLDDCIADKATLAVNDPGNGNTLTTQTYWFQTGDTGNAGFTGQSSSGTIQLPGLGGHVMHFAIVGYNGTPGPSTLTYTGPEQIAVVP